MPHVFTLEGAHIGADVNFPEAGQPLAPHEAIVGPTRVATPVYGPGGTPIMYRRRYPARGPVCDYCDPDYFTAMNGGQTVIPYRPQQFGDFGRARYRRQLGQDPATTFLDRQTPMVQTGLAAGGAIVVGAALAGFGVWLYHKVGYKPRPATRHAYGWGGRR